jgi:uncharacterized protein (TIGR03435 family)
MRAIACICAALVGTTFAQTPQDLISFEVATVKLHPPGSPEGISTTQSGGPGTNDPGRITIVNRTLHRLLIESFVLKGYQLQDPPSLDQVRYDIVAKVPPGATEQDVRVMMQNLLIERLKLKIRHEHEIVPVWALVVGKGGPKFKASGETAPAGDAASPVTGKPRIDPDGFPIESTDHAKPGIFRSTNNSGSLKITAVRQTMAQFVSALFGQTDHPIMDLTGLDGKYDFSVVFGAHWKTELSNMPTEGQGSGAPMELRPADGPSIFEAVKEQLGLKLEPRKMPADLVIVDSGQKTPVEN